jgi:hypothetical protein
VKALVVDDEFAEVAGPFLDDNDMNVTVVIDWSGRADRSVLTLEPFIDVRSTAPPMWRPRVPTPA